jgi:hypothetical protein
VTQQSIIFEDFEFPRISGLEYLTNGDDAGTDFLFINEPSESFSMYFERNFPIFTVPDSMDRDYGLFEFKRQDKLIKFFCPQKRENISSVIWYFYVEMLDESGEKHTLPGQVRVAFDVPDVLQSTKKPRFIDVLEQVKLNL